MDLSHRECLSHCMLILITLYVVRTADARTWQGQKIRLLISQKRKFSKGAFGKPKVLRKSAFTFNQKLSCSSTQVHAHLKYNKNDLMLCFHGNNRGHFDSWSWALLWIDESRTFLCQPKKMKPIKLFLSQVHHGSFVSKKDPNLHSKRTYQGITNAWKKGHGVWSKPMEFGLSLSFYIYLHW